MKKESVRALILGLFLAGLVVIAGLQAQERKVMVLNPLGQPPPITQVSMAARLDTLDGKTIYIVDVGFEGTHQCSPRADRG